MQVFSILITQQHIKKCICVCRRLVRWGISLTHSAPSLKACELRDDYCLGSSVCNWFTLKFPAGILIYDAYSQSSDYPRDRSLLSSQGWAARQGVKQKLWDVWRDRVHMSPVPGYAREVIRQHEKSMSYLDMDPVQLIVVSLGRKTQT